MADGAVAEINGILSAMDQPDKRISRQASAMATGTSKPAAGKARTTRNDHGRRLMIDGEFVVVDRRGHEHGMTLTFLTRIVAFGATEEAAI